MSKLEILRKKIDEIDYRIHDLLNERAKYALEIAKVKMDNDGNSVEFYRPEREAQILKQITTHNKGPLAPTAVANIFRAIMTACRQLQIDSHSEKKL